MLLWPTKCLTPFLKVEKSVVGFCIFVYQVKTYAFLVKSSNTIKNVTAYGLRTIEGEVSET